VKRSTVAIAVIAVLVLVGIFFIGIKDTGKDAANQNTTPTASPNTKIGIEKGDIAPDFELLTPEGQKVKLSDFRGKKVILNFWATWCPPCRAEMPDIQNFYSQNSDKVVLAVNLTSTEKDFGNVAKFIKEYGITFPVVLDKESKTATMYQISAIPTSYIIDTNGVIQQKIVGPMNYEMMTKVLAQIH
jgi:peroxiredoxin